MSINNRTGIYGDEFNLEGPLDFKGAIAVAADFPTAAAVQNGWFYAITATVTDNDATKTNTGQSFSSGDEIAWDEANSQWLLLGNNSTSAPIDAHYVTTQAESGLDNEFNLGSLTSGLLKHTVAAGVSTPATAVAGTDYVETETDPVVGAVNGIVKADGAGNISAAVAGTDYYNPGGTDVAIADGGTGASTAATGFDNLAPTTTEGDLIYRGASGNTRLAKGTAGQVLTMNAGATAPEWADATSGSNFPYFEASTNFDDISTARYVTSVVGTGAVTQTTGVRVDSSATANASAYIDWTISGANLLDLDTAVEFSTIISTTNVDTDSSGYIGIGDLVIAGTGITFTGNHIGFEIDGSSFGIYNIYATVGNGAAQTRSLLLSGAASGPVRLALKYVSGTASFYAKNNASDWTAAVDITTNLPSANETLMRFGVSNQNTTDRANFLCYGASFKAY